MILIEEVSRHWARDGEWRIAPAGLTWIVEGGHVIVGDGCTIVKSSRIGDYSILGKYSHIGDEVDVPEELL